MARSYKIKMMGLLLRPCPATEFKEIRREWKARRKEEEAQRKAEEERQRQAAASAAATAHANGQGTDGPAGAPGEPGPAGQYAPPRNVQLPPIGYQPNQYPTPSSAGAPPPNLSEYPPASGHMYQGTGYQQPPSPYAAPPSGGQIYNQRRLVVPAVPANGYSEPPDCVC